MAHQTVLVLDFGSQYTQLIARRIREMGVYCEIKPCTTPVEPPRARQNPSGSSGESPALRSGDSPPSSVGALIGVILSGGPASVLGADAPPFDTRWLDLPVPILGVCYGFQLLAHTRGGQVGRGTAREYGPARIRLEGGSPLFMGLDADTPHDVWMSHGDHVEAPPAGWSVVARSGGVVAAAQSPDGRSFGLQFHPEVEHTRPGRMILENFVVGVCGATRDWDPGRFVDEQVEAIRAQVGEGKVLCALSGGVDSAVTAALVRRAIGDRLTCLFVDTGLSREGEAESVRQEFEDFDLRVVDARGRFLSALDGVTDPERKRKIIGSLFIEVFEEEAAKLGTIDFLAQGTLYPDVIESVSVRGPSAVIKSHHNVGGLPEKMRMRLVEPLRELFKDEARAVGLKLGLSESRVYRQPFPGPGLAVRCLGPITAGRLSSLRRADAIVRAEIEAAGWDRKVWQSFAVLLPVRSVGVMGDERTFEEACAIRAVHSTDGMTADWVQLPYDLLGRISARIINEVRGINRVVYDISSKPPATIEWE